MWKWLKNLFSKKIIDANELIDIKYSLCVNSEGKLTLGCYGLLYHIVGVITWDNNTKKVFKVYTNKTVLDLLTSKKATKTV